MNLIHIQHKISRAKARILGFTQSEPPCGPHEIEQLAETIVDFGRMRQPHGGSCTVLVGAAEMAMRLRETTQTIVKALRVLKKQGRAEETGASGRWRLYLSIHPADPIREGTSSRI